MAVKPAGHSGAPLVEKLGTAADDGATMIHALASGRALLEPLPGAVAYVDGADADSDIIQKAIRTVALPIGFVGIKACAGGGVRSGPKRVVREELR